MENGGFSPLIYRCKLVVGNVAYKCAEHYYQSMKAASDDDRRKIRDAPSGYVAKDWSHSLGAGGLINKSPKEKI